MPRLTGEIASLADPAAAFVEASLAPLDAHSSGTLDEAETILAQYPQLAASSIYTAAILADEDLVRAFLASDPLSATATGGTRGWDALTHLCFSRYLRLDRRRSEAFVRTARALLDGGASANTGWIETIDHRIRARFSKPQSTARPESPNTQSSLDCSSSAGRIPTTRRHRIMSPRRATIRCWGFCLQAES